MTIRELADEYGVSQQAVRAQLSRVRLDKKMLRNADGSLSDAAEKALRQHYDRSQQVGNNALSTRCRALQTERNTLAAELEEAKKTLADLSNIAAEKQALKDALAAQSAQLNKAKEKAAELSQRLSEAAGKMEELTNALSSSLSTIQELSRTNASLTQQLLPGQTAHKGTFQWPWKRKT